MWEESNIGLSVTVGTEGTIVDRVMTTTYLVLPAATLFIFQKDFAFFSDLPNILKVDMLFNVGEGT